MIENYGKRILSFLMALIMVISMVPGQVFATETGDDHEHCEVCGQHDCICCETCGQVECVCPPEDEEPTDAPTETPTEAPTETPTEDPTEAPKAEREYPADWTDEMKEVQALIDEYIDYYLVYYGFVVPEGELTEEEWESVYAQIEDIVVNKMDANERENALMAVREVEYMMVEEYALTDEQGNAILEANPVFVDFASVVSAYGVTPEQLAVSGSLTDTNIVLSNSNGTWSASGTGITGSVQGGSLFGSYFAAETTLTIKNNRTYPIVLYFDYSIYFRESGESYLHINGTQVQKSSKEGQTLTGNSGNITIAAGGSIPVKVTAGKRSGNNKTELTITNIVAKRAVTFGGATGGTYTVTPSTTNTAETVTTSNLVKTEACGTEYTVVATPNTADGYYFDGWYNGTAKVGTETTLTFSNETYGDIKPVFARNETTITFGAPQDGQGSYTVNGATPPASDTQVTGYEYTLVATPGEHSTFVGWFKDSDTTALTTDPTLIFTTGSTVISGDCTIYPKFYDLKQFAVTVTGEGGTVTGAGTVYEGESVTLSATANSGYTFLGWTDTSGKILSTATTYTFTPAADTTVKAIFAKDGGNAVFAVGTQSSRQSFSETFLWQGTDFYYYTVSQTHLFEDLGDAITAAQNGTSKVVIPVNNGVITGNYEIPSGVTLLIPYDAANTLNTTNPVCSGKVDVPAAVANIYAYRTLTMASGSSITVKSGGAINVNAKLFAIGGSDVGGGSPLGGYGYIKMQDGSNITIESGAALYAYGYIGGTGTVTAKSGSTIYEIFQVEDFRGGTVTSDMAQDTTHGIFPMMNYAVQNVLAPMTLESGATEYAYASLFMSSASFGTAVKFISNTGAMFNLESGSVTKKYDYATDRMVITAHSGVMSISNITMGISNITLDSKNFDLPITGSMTIDITSGSTIKLNQDVALLPGVEIYIRDGAACELTTGSNLFIFDLDQWPLEDYASYVGANRMPMLATYFVPERQYTRTKADLKDVLFEVAGDVVISGYVYTTGTLDDPTTDANEATGGAAIKGVEGTGAKITLKPGTPDSANHYQMIQNATEYSDCTKVKIALTDAKLQNADGSYTDPNGINPTNGTTYTYTDGVWVPKCNTVDGVSGCEKVLKDTTKEFSCINPYICQYCEDELETTGHTPGAAATCTTDQICTVEGCGHVITEKLNHNYQPVNGRADSCATGVSGWKASYICQTSDVEGQYCGKHFADQNGTLIGDGSDAAFEAWKTGDGKVDDAQHDPGNWIKDDREGTYTNSTCTVAGSHQEYKICGSCKEEVARQTVTDPLAAHTYVDVPGKADSCKDGETGYLESFMCEVCGKHFSDDQGTLIGKNGTYDEWVAWTTTGAGVVDNVDHVPGPAATCTTAQTCTTCNGVLQANLGHQFTNWVKGEVLDEDSYYKVSACDRGCGTEEKRLVVNGQEVNHSGIEQVAYKAATCTEEGHEAYWKCTDTACQVPDCNGQTVGVITVISATGHTLVDSLNVEYSWNADYSVCTASGGCGRGCGESYSVTTENITSQVLSTVSCDQDGKTQFTATFAAKVLDDKEEPVTTSTTRTDAVAYNHNNWENATIKYEWSTDYTTCTATRTCVYGCTEQDEASGEKVTYVVTNPTCEADGYTVYAADFTLKWAKDQTSDQVKNVGAATGHTWTIDGELGWSDNDETCTVNLECSNNSSHTKDNVELEVEKNLIKEDTCEQAGEVTYTPAFKASDFGEKDTLPTLEPKTVYPDAVQHIWSEITYTWGENNATCTAKRTCGVDTSHVEEQTVDATADNGSATCTAAGVITYTANFTEGVFADKTDTATTPQGALGHSVETVAEVPATCQKTGTKAHFKCTTCGELFETAEDAENNKTISAENLKLAVVGHNYVNYVYNNDASCTKAGTMTGTCSYGCGTEDTVNDPAHPQLAHTYTNYVYNNDATCLKAGTETAECDTCDTNAADTRNSEEHPMKEHEYTREVVQVSPKCTTAGSLRKYCVNGCTGNFISVDINPLGHAYNLIEGQPATCEEPGYADHYWCGTVARSGERTIFCGSYFANESDTTPIASGETVEEIQSQLDAWKADTTGNGGGIVAKGHNYDEGVITTPATCTVDGVKTFTCSNEEDCSYTEPVPATGHSYASETTTQPTCTEKGIKTFTCINGDCDDSYTEDIDANGHTLVEVKEVVPTCQDNGTKAYWQCSVESCGACFENQDETAPITDLDAWKTGAGKIDATGEHSWGEGYYAEESDKPACEKEGTLTKKCVHCNEATTTEPVDALEHVWVNDQDNATCTEDGYLYSKRCRTCKTEVDINEVIPATGHAPYVAGIISYSTCTVPGSQRVRCGNYGCNYETTQPMDLDPHNLEPVSAEAPSCTEDGVLAHYNCKVCGGKFEDRDGTVKLDSIVDPATGHAVTVVPGKAVTCLEDGYKEAYYCGTCRKHFATKISETELDDEIDGALTEWQTTGAGKITAPGHNLVEQSGLAATCETVGFNAYYQCVADENRTVCCGATFEDAEGQTPIEDLAAWKAEGGAGHLAALDHNYTSEVTQAPTCTADGVRTYTCQNDKSHKYTEVELALGHEYEIEYTWNADLTACTALATCKNNSNHQGQMSAVVTKSVVEPATCEEDGSGTVLATFSNNQISEYGVENQSQPVTIPATGHAFNNYVSDNDATCTEDGHKTATCDNGCGKTETVVDEGSAKGHNTEYVAPIEPDCTKTGIIEHYQCKACLGRFYDAEGKQPVEEGKHIVAALNHDYNAAVTPPTCEDKGYTTYTCSRGDDTYVADYVDALGHDYDWDGGKVVTAPTCTDKGYTTYDCSRCDETHTGDEVAKTGHATEYVAAKPATCLDAGWKAHVKCTACNQYYKDLNCTMLIGDEDALEAWKNTSGQGKIDATGHNLKDVVGKTPDCDDAGYLPSYKCHNSCGNYFSNKEDETLIGDGSEAAWNTWIAEDGAGYLAPNGHTEGEKITVNAVEPKCEVDGSYEVVTKCAVCQDEISKETVVDPATGHLKITAKDGKAASCTVDGYEAYWQCGDCNKLFSDAEGKNVITERVTIPASGHTEVKIPAVEATCTAMGKGEGKQCSVCGIVTEAQPDVPMKEHMLDEIISTTMPTCTVDGSQVVGCVNCDYETTEVLKATGHTEEEIPAKAPNCTTVGASAGVKCTTCGEVLTAPETIPATGHDYDWDGGNVVTEPTCTAKGYTTHICSVCGFTTKDTYTDMAPHTKAIREAVPATCTTTGLTEGEYCSVCTEVLKAQQVVQKTPHSEVIDGKKDPTCTETGLTEGKHCSVCNETLVEQTEVPAKGHSGKLVTGQAPTCEQPGWKDYFQCQNTCGLFYEDEVCAKLIGDDKALEAWQKGDGKLTELGHKWDNGRVTTLPTCTEEGVKTFTCDTCNGTRTEAEPMLGHDAVQHAGQHPTYYSVGWEPYETCNRPGCEYTTMVGIPALGEPSVGTYEEFMFSLKMLEEYANAYAKANPGKDPMWLLIKYVRTGVDRYNSGSWNIMAGYEDEAFAEYVKKQEEAYNKTVPTIDDMINVTGIKNIKNFRLPNNQSVDFGHMFGTMDITYHNKTSINHADVAGWAGDLVDLLSTADRHDVTGTVDEMIKEIGSTYLNHHIDGEDDQFGQTDMYGDLDGYYFMNELIGQDYENGMLYNMMNSYFTESLTDEQRADYFLKNRLGGVTGRNEIREAVFSEYLGNQVIATLEGTREFKQTDVSDMRKACCYAFADYLCKLAGDYVELGENPYFSVFSTELSTLAPGITQQISKATTADGKQVVYYIATADVNSPYVDVYANYKDNDPSQGWGMQRVLDQANAAQAKYGDPNSDKYIENYNVIAAINGAGYNMTTGEPAGVLMMGGVEYHAPDGNGFIGILKDGTATLGTTAQYYELKEQGLLSEAIAIFGTTLVKDGKINVTATDNYYNDRASRTAFGITKTGKVVFMVMDGRQEPVSCGGSAVEIAQVMLEAGCVYAVNLDGGGSTTYIARQEGADELSLVSSPSDGFQRSVSTSWMMVSTAPSSTAFDHAVLDSEVRHLTIGATVQVTATGVSATGNPAELPEGVTWAVSDASIASITEDGLVTALANGKVDVQLMLGDKVVGTRTLNVVVPDAVYFTKENMNAVYGEPAKLPVAALFEGKPVAILESDVFFKLSNETAGTTEGFTFIGNEASGIKAVKINALAVNNPDATSGSMGINLFRADEASFDFDNVTGGDRLLAWNRVVSNSTTVDSVTYNVKDKTQPMVTEYTFAMDMTQIPMPEELTDLVYMLPGADVEGNNSAWDFLLQLAERVSVLTTVKATLRLDPNFDVDYSKMTVNCEYFILDKVEHNPETNELILSLHWKDQTKAIDPDTANPLVIMAGIKLTPKADADWDTKERLDVVNVGNISYDIYLRANALYSFASKPENQAAFNLHPFINPDVIIGGAPESGGHFEDTYKEFTDEYTLNKGMKNGWVYEDGGYAYYEDDVKYTGVRKVGQFYYDFGENGINMGQTKYTGMFQIDGVNHYSKEGVLSGGWFIDGNNKYYFDETGKAVDGETTLDEVKMNFENGLLIGGHTGFLTKTSGNTYYYQNGSMYYGWLEMGDYWYCFDETNGIMVVGDGTAATKLFPTQEAKAKGAYYVFDEEGHALYGFPNNYGYYYWADLQAQNQWVRNGYDLDGWYRTNANAHYVTASNAAETFQLTLGDKTYTAVKIAIDGVVYTFDNSNGKLLLGSMVTKNDKWYYYWAGEPVNDGWFDFNGETYYAFEDGHLATGSQTIDGENHMFTPQGALIENGTTLNVTMSADFSQMIIKTSQIKDVDYVKMGVWSQASNQEDMNWFEATVDANGVWTAVVPMCLYENIGTYLIHTYEFDENNTPVKLLVDTTYEVTKAGVHAAGKPVKVNVVAPTCTKDGGYDLVTTCSVCDELIKTEHVTEPATGHKDNDDNYECDVCGEFEEIETIAMHRLFNPNTGEHFYTGSTEERDMLVEAGWNYEGVAWNAPTKIGSSIYRLYNPNSGDHHYTGSAEERDMLVELGWVYEGVAWNTLQPNNYPQYRLYNPNADIGSHHYTGSIEEREMLVEAGWIYEGIGWYGSPR